MPSTISVSLAPGSYFFWARARPGVVPASRAAAARAICLLFICMLVSSSRSRMENSVLARPHVAEQVACHLAHLDLLRSLGDAVAAVVAVDVLERLVARITQAAVHLHGAVGRLADQPVRPVVAHRHL